MHTHTHIQTYTHTQMLGVGTSGGGGSAYQQLTGPLGGGPLGGGGSGFGHLGDGGDMLSSEDAYRKAMRLVDGVLVSARVCPH